MLEQNRNQLVNGLQKMYSLLINDQGWPGRPLERLHKGQPLTHDVLERLDAIRVEGPVKLDHFPESTSGMLQALTGDDDRPLKREASPASDSTFEHASPSDAASPPDAISLPDAISPPDTISPESLVADPPPRPTARLPPTPIQTPPSGARLDVQQWTVSPTCCANGGAMLTEAVPYQAQSLTWPHHYGAYESPMIFNNLSPTFEYTVPWDEDLPHYNTHLNASDLRTCNEMSEHNGRLYQALPFNTTNKLKTWQDRQQ
ncbi:MAG: hypothetical protein L6R40_005613 [Gallowayella cf. fulva]|nr:MAG: hypothetical protein L6R40_005613 [Xanthomendoza cf. fulva]